MELHMSDLGERLDARIGPALPPARRARRAPAPEILAALDLGTNNCRLLVARPSPDGFRVIDAFSRIVRLGEGVSGSGRLSDDAMERTLAALQICAAKMRRKRVTRARTVATEACRRAANGAAFLERVRRETGLHLDVISSGEEARLAVAGCAPLIAPDAASALVFDIGGGSTELMWLKRDGRRRPRMAAWTSLRSGVVTLAERYGGREISAEDFEAMVRHVGAELAPFAAQHAMPDDPARAQMLGTSGTVTTLAGVHLDLARYDRARVDGLWLDAGAADAVARRLRGMTYEERAAHPCIGHERADLVVAGCAILEAIRRAWPIPRLRVADRGVREGLLLSLIRGEAALN
jgi:exopolyphosphatase / guanosine-5'-triphosphate,3'-diphosphate pyrophosphatase